MWISALMVQGNRVSRQLCLPLHILTTYCQSWSQPTPLNVDIVSILYVSYFGNRSKVTLACITQSQLGMGPANNLDEFLEKIQMAFDPPSFSENYIAIFFPKSPI